MTDKKPELGAWINDNSGAVNRLRRASITPFGMHRNEVFNPQQGERIIRDYSPLSAREIFQWSEPMSEDQGIRRLRDLKRATQYNQIAFLDKVLQVKKRVKVIADHRIQVDLRQDTSSEIKLDSSRFDDPNYVVSITYGSNGIEFCMLQSEYAGDIEDQESQTWQQQLPALLNYLRELDRDEFPMMKRQELHNYNESVSRYAKGVGDARMGLVAKAAEQLFAEILQVVPEEERKEAERLLEACGLNIVVAEKALYEICTEGFDSIERPLGPARERAVLDQTIQEEIGILTAHPGEHLQILEMKNISAAGFEYQEVEVDDAGKKGADVSFEKRKIIAQEHGHYEKTIRVQDKRFVISREGDMLSVTCSNWKKTIWQAVFPTTVPVDQLVGYGNNPEVDFRPVEDALKSTTLQYNT